MVPVVVGPVGCGHHKIQIVHKYRGCPRDRGDVRPCQRDLEGLVELRHREGVGEGGPAVQRLLLILVEDRPGEVEEVFQVDAAPSLVEVGDRPSGRGPDGGTRYRRHVHGPVDEGGLRQGGAGVDGNEISVVLHEEGGAARDHGSGHTRPATVFVVGVDVLPTPSRRGRAGEQRSDPRARRHKVRLDPPVGGGATTAEPHDGVDVVRGPRSSGGHRRAIVEGSSGRDHVLRVSRAARGRWSRTVVGGRDFEDDGLVSDHNVVSIPHQFVEDCVFDDVFSEGEDPPAVAVDDRTVAVGVSAHLVVIREDPGAKIVEDALVNDEGLRGDSQSPRETVPIEQTCGVVTGDDAGHVGAVAHHILCGGEAPVGDVSHRPVVQLGVHVPTDTRVVRSCVDARVGHRHRDVLSGQSEGGQPVEVTRSDWSVVAGHDLARHLVHELRTKEGLNPVHPRQVGERRQSSGDRGEPQESEVAKVHLLVVHDGHTRDGPPGICGGGSENQDREVHRSGCRGRRDAASEGRHRTGQCWETEETAPRLPGGHVPVCGNPRVECRLIPELLVYQPADAIGRLVDANPLDERCRLRSSCARRIHLHDEGEIGDVVVEVDALGLHGPDPLGPHRPDKLQQVETLLAGLVGVYPQFRCHLGLAPCGVELHRPKSDYRPVVQRAEDEAPQIEVGERGR